MKFLFLFLTFTIYNLQTYYNLGSIGTLYANIYNTSYTTNKKQKKKTKLTQKFTHIHPKNKKKSIHILSIFLFL